MLTRLPVELFDVLKLRTGAEVLDKVWAAAVESDREAGTAKSKVLLCAQRWIDREAEPCRGDVRTEKCQLSPRYMPCRSSDDAVPGQQAHSLPTFDSPHTRSAALNVNV